MTALSLITLGRIASGTGTGTTVPCNIVGAVDPNGKVIAGQVINGNGYVAGLATGNNIIAGIEEEETIIARVEDE